MKRELIPQFEALLERLSEWRGALVEVVERLTRSPGTLDRHSTTTSQLVMRLEFVGVAFSGGSLTLMGKAFDRDVSYQATIDRLERMSLGIDEMVFVEKFGSAAERHSTFRRLPEFHEAETGTATGLMSESPVA